MVHERPDTRTGDAPFWRTAYILHEMSAKLLGTQGRK